MKNKLLVNLFAVGIAALALTACETKSNVTEVCSDMIKETLHKSARSLAQLDGQSLTVSEYEFVGGVNDNRILFRKMVFGNGTFEPKTVDTLTYQYGEWSDRNTVFSMFVTPKKGEPYTLLYKGNAFVDPAGHVFGGEPTTNVARVEKWEKAVNTFPNTDWEATFRGEFVLDSVFRDSVKVTILPPMRFIYDTIKIYDHMDTVAADTSCYFKLTFDRDANTLKNTGHFYSISVRSKYDNVTKTIDTISSVVKEYDYVWYFSEVSSDSKFVIRLDSQTPKVEGDRLSISKYKLNDAGVPVEFLLGGSVYTRPQLP